MPHAPPPRRRSRLRRALVVLGILAVLVVGAAVAVVILLPHLARPAIERALSGALGMPVTIGTLDWQPRDDRLTLADIALGSGAAQTTVRRIVVEVSPRALFDGHIIVERVVVEAPAGAVELDADYRPRLPGFGGDALGDRIVPPVTIRQVLVTDLDLTVRYPVQGELRAAQLRLTQFEASDLTDTAGGPAMRATLAGTLDAAPLEASANVQLGTDGGVTIAAVGRVTGLEINSRTIDLLPALQTFRALVDVQATYASAVAPEPTLRLDVTLHEPRITDDAGTEFAAQRIDLPAVRVDPVDGTIALDRLLVDHPVGIVQLDAQYRPTVGRFGRESRGRDAAPIEVRLREVVVSDGALTVRYPVDGRQRAAPLHLTRLVCSDVVLASDQVGMQVQLSGTVDGAALEGRARLQLGGAAPAVEGELRVTGLVVDRTRLDLPPGFATARATVDAAAVYESTSAPPRQELRLEARLREARLTGPTDTAFSAASATFPAVRVDFAARHLVLGDLAIDTPELTLALTDAGLVLPVGAVADAPESAWTIETGAIEVRTGRVRLRRGAATFTLGAVAGRWDGRRADGPQPLTLQATTDGGGTIAVSGRLGVAPLDAQLDIDTKALPLAPLAALTQALPLQLTRGSGDATVALTQRDGAVHARGRVRLRDTHTAPPNPGRPVEVMAVHLAEADFTLDHAEQTVVEVASLSLSYPYVLVQRRADGTFPYDLVTAGTTVRAAEPARLRLHRLVVEGGKVEFLDSTLAPPYWTSLSGLRGDVVDDAQGPDGDRRFTLTGKQDEISAVDLVGRLTGSGVSGRGSVRDAPLQALNPYVAPLLGYDVTAGWLSLDVDARPAPPGYAATARMVLRGIDVRQTGVDVIQQQSGVPLPIALNLITDLGGTVDLTLPLSLDLASRRVTLGSVVGQAVRSALVGALTSPLRILGSLFGTKGAPHAFAIDPIPFPAGGGALDASGAARVAEIARILDSHTGLVLVATPQLTATDLAAIGSDGAPALAAARLAAVRTAFTGANADPSLPVARLMLVEWRPASGAPPADPPGVYVELQDQP